MHCNSGKTMVGALRLGDHIWSHSADLGIVIGLALTGPAFDHRGGPKIDVATINGDAPQSGRTTYHYLADDLVHVGEHSPHHGANDLIFIVTNMTDRKRCTRCREIIPLGAVYDHASEHGVGRDAVRIERGIRS